MIDYRNRKGRTDLEKKAWQLRLELLRMFSYGKAHHFGGCLSCAEIVAALFFYKMNHKLPNFQDPERDRFIMSKGHSIPTQYVALAMLGLISVNELKSIKSLGSRLQGHPDILKLPLLEAPTGSLGQGLSYANGLALAARLDGLQFDVFVLIGDGELQEGQLWEAAMTTHHYRLNNVCAIVDMNGYQSQGAVDMIKSIEPLADKWRAFGWHSIRVKGHDLKEICQALDLVNGQQKKPISIIAETVKGKGVSFMENTFKYHNLDISPEDYRRAEAEILDKLGQLNEL